MWGSSRLGSIRKNFQILSSFSKDIYLVSGNNDRCITHEQFVEHLGNEGYKSVGKGDIHETLREVYKREDLKDKVVLIFGSFFIMEEAR